MTTPKPPGQSVQFTPGPWHALNVSEIDRISNHWVINANSPHVGGKSQMICSMNGPWKPKNYEANAKLIAAAPTLYEFVVSRANQGDVFAKAMLDRLGQ